jgi:hypothetical protein
MYVHIAERCAMNFEGLIEFTKYTLALSAGGFLYTLEKLVPSGSMPGRYLVLGLLVLFLASTLFGIAIFGMSTAALHRDSLGQARLRKLMQPLGITHACLLFLAMVVLGGMTYSRVMREPGAEPLHCSCSITASVPQK